MTHISVDKSLCLKDGICTRICPIGLIVQDDEGYPTPTPYAEKVCARCGHCMAYCPSGALSVFGVDPHSLHEFRKERTPDFPSVSQLLKMRRSNRQYRETPVPREVLSEVIEVARWAPSGHNAQPVHWLVISEREDVLKLGGHVVEAMRGMNLFPSFVKLWEQGRDVIFRGAPQLVATFTRDDAGLSLVDAVIATTYFDIAANARGLGTCWAGLLMIAAGNHEPAHKALDLPEGHLLRTAMMVGYPRFGSYRAPFRKEARITWR